MGHSNSCFTKLKLLIVDDERAVREGLKLLMDWDANNIEIVGLAEDGVEAIELIKKSDPDVVLTDVKMLGMDGIMLSKWISENRPHIKVIFLSAYCDFEYAQNAIRYGVVDYLLKPVKTNQLFEIIEKLRSQNLKEKAEKMEIDRFKSLLDKNMSILREKYIRDVLDGKYEGDIEGLFNLYGMDLIGNSYILAVISFEASSAVGVQAGNKSTDNDFIKLELADLISSIIQNPYKAYIFNENNESIGVVFSINSQYEKPYMYTGIIGALEKIREAFSEKGWILTIGVSNMNTGSNTLSNSYLEAVSALKSRVYIGKNLIIPYVSLNAKQTSFMEIEEVDKIYEYMKNLDWFSVQQSIRNYFDCCKASYDILEKYPQFIIFQLISVLKKTLEFYGEFSKTAINQDEVDKLLKCTTMQDMYDEIIIIFKRYFNILIKKKNSGSNKIILEIKGYIEKNFMNNISLTEVAEYVYLSPTYLSKLFFKETGVSFSEYLIQYRLERARELLLKSDLKVYEISENIGYHSEKHFINLFKKVVGVSPQEFRKINSKI